MIKRILPLALLATLMVGIGLQATQLSLIHI